MEFALTSTLIHRIRFGFDILSLERFSLFANFFIDLHNRDPAKLKELGFWSTDFNLRTLFFPPFLESFSATWRLRFIIARYFWTKKFLSYQAKLFQIDDEIRSLSPENVVLIYLLRNLWVLQRIYNKNWEHECLNFKVQETFNCVKFYLIIFQSANSELGRNLQKQYDFDF